GFDFGLDSSVDPMRERIARATRSAEPASVEALVPIARLSPQALAQTQALAASLAAAVRAKRAQAAGVDALMAEFSLDSEEGVEPLVRKGVDLALRLLGKQFVAGRTIDEALANAREREARGYTFSFDMLGEAAMTARDAERYFKAYETAIHAIGHAAGGRGIVAGPGISVKLSALHPRYTRAARQRVRDELTPKALELARLA